MEKLYNGNTMAEIKSAVKKIDSTPELKRVGQELTRKAKAAAASRKKSANQDIGEFSKELARHIVSVPVSFAVPDFGQPKRCQPGKFVWDNRKGKLVKV